MPGLLFEPELLIETDVNPAPAATKAALLRLPDGKTLRYAITHRDIKQSLGTVILLQGRNEYIEKYFETISDLSQRGFTVATFDWRGQGGSDRLIRDPMRGYVRRFADYAADLHYFLHDVVLPDCPPPYYILAHSAGALIALSALPKINTTISRMVLAAPLLGLEGQLLRDDRLRKLTVSLRRLGLGRLYAAHGPRPLEGRAFANNPLTSDAARYTRNSEVARLAPQLALGGPTIRWVSSALDTIQDINHPGYFSGVSVPVLLLIAGNDRVVRNPATEEFAARIRNATLITIDGARHELMQEIDFYREQFWAAFDAFIPGTHAPQQALESE